MSTTFKKQQVLGIRVLPRGFTLVELLVVIGIIGILTSLASVAMFRGLTAAKQARTAAEVTQLAGAIEQFKLKFGEYPPSFLDHSDLNSRAMMKRFLAKAFPRCNPDVELWYIPWCDDTNSYYPYLDTTGALSFWDPANVTSSGTKKPMSAAQALVFWLTSISRDPAHPLSKPTDNDRISFFDFDNGRISRLNSTQSPTNNVSGSGWAVLTGSFNPPSWSQGPTAAVAGMYPKYNVGTYAPRDGLRQAYVYFEARCYLFHALFLSGSSFPPASSNPPPLNNPPVPYLSQSTPWDTNSNGVLDAGLPNGTTVFDVTTDNMKNVLPQTFTTFQNLCVNPKSFQIISAGADNDFGLVNTSATNGGAPITQCRNLSYVPNTATIQVDIYYKSYPDGQGYDNLANGDDDNITNFSESPLGNAKSR